MKEKILVLAIMLITFSSADAASNITVQPFCYESSGSLHVLTLVEGKVIREGTPTEKVKFIFKAFCPSPKIACSIAIIKLNGLDEGLPLGSMDVIAADGEYTVLGNKKYRIMQGFDSYTVDLNKKAVYFNAQSKKGTGMCD